jgi:hypothetical protein
MYISRFKRLTLHPFCMGSFVYPLSFIPTSLTVLLPSTPLLMHIHSVKLREIDSPFRSKITCFSLFVAHLHFEVPRIRIARRKANQSTERTELSHKYAEAYSIPTNNYLWESLILSFVVYYHFISLILAIYFLKFKNRPKTN